MELDLVFNELSVKALAPDKEIAKQWMFQLIQTIRSFTAQGVKVNIRSQVSFYHIMLAPNYSISQWCKEASEKERRFIKTLSKKTPLSQDLLNIDIQEIENNQGLLEFRYKDQVALGLGVASPALLDTIAISFISNECWNLSLLEIQSLEYSEEEKEVIENLVVRHASFNIHVEDHVEWIQDKIQIDIADGTDIWDRREDLFPHLEFCENLAKQIQSLYYGTPILKQVEKKLFELENYCKTWTDGVFNADLLASKATPESQSRLDSLEEKLTFKCPDGKNRIFSWHLRMTGAGAWRLHFFPKLEISPKLGTGKIIIGYIGEKIQ